MDLPAKFAALIAMSYASSNALMTIVTATNNPHANAPVGDNTKNNRSMSAKTVRPDNFMRTRPRTPSRGANRMMPRPVYIRWTNRTWRQVILNCASAVLATSITALLFLDRV